jgi:DNA replication protein DnaC
VETTVNDMIQADILFLDDLGSERIKGSYVEDFAASQLDVVVDERYRREAPIFYTTNLDMGGLIEFYGARLVSRLCGDNPLVVVTGLKDQRFK